MIGGPIIGLAIMSGVGSEAGAAAVVVAECHTSGPVPGLSAVQARNARTIVTATQALLISNAQPPDSQTRAELIAIMTAETDRRYTTTPTRRCRPANNYPATAIHPAAATMTQSDCSSSEQTGDR